LLGLAFAGLSYAYAACHDYTRPMSGLDFVFMTIPSIHCEVIGRDGFIMYSIIAALNVALYFLVGTVIVALRKTHNPVSSG
jgi:hypothetical protein